MMIVPAISWGLLLLIIVTLQARSATGSPISTSVEQQLSMEAALESKWNAIHRGMGNEGMTLLCQALLPQATEVHTGESTRS